MLLESCVDRYKFAIVCHIPGREATTIPATTPSTTRYLLTRFCTRTKSRTEDIPTASHGPRLEVLYTAQNISARDIQSTYRCHRPFHTLMRYSARGMPIASASPNRIGCGNV